MNIKRWKGSKERFKFKVKIRGRSRMSVSMGVIPCLNKEQARIFLKDLDRAVLKQEVFKDCDKKMQELLEKEGL